MTLLNRRLGTKNRISCLNGLFGPSSSESEALHLERTGDVLPAGPPQAGAGREMEGCYHEDLRHLERLETHKNHSKRSERRS